MALLGRLNNFGMALETVRNTAATVPAIFMPWLTLEADIKNDDFIDKSSFGIVHDVLYTDISKQWFEGKISGNLDIDFANQFLYYFYGNNPTPTSSLGSYTWVYTALGSTALPTFTAFFQQGDNGWYKATGCIFKDLKIKMIAGGNISIEADIIGLSAAPISAPTVSYTKPNKISLGKNVVLAYAANVAALSAPTAIALKEINIDLSRNTKDYAVLGNLSPIDTFSNQFTIKASCKFVIAGSAAATLQSDFIAGNKKAFKLSVVNTNQAFIGTSTNKPTLNFIMAVSRFNIKTERPQDDVVVGVLDFMPEFSPTDGYAIQATTINAVATIS